MKKHEIQSAAGVLFVIVVAMAVMSPAAQAAIESRDILKTFFETGDVPTQDQFVNLIDSYVHKTDDGLTLVAIAAKPDGTAAGRFLRIGSNVGINETMPDTLQAAWRPSPTPNIPPIPGMCPSFCGTSGFLPLKYENAAGTATHYGFLQISMAAAPPNGTALATVQDVAPGPAIFVSHWVWESTAGATLTTFVVPEPASAAILFFALPLTLLRRRNGARGGSS